VDAVEELAGSLGGGSLTIRCRSSSMLIWLEPPPPPSRLTPLLLRLLWPLGLKVPRKSSSSSSSLYP
jgi:hypothetical protein